MSDLPLDAHLWAIVPFPAWSAAVDPRVREWSVSVDVEHFIASAARSLGRLAEYGFELLPRDSWEVGADVAVVGSHRDDAAVVVVALQGSMFVAAIHGPLAEASVAAAITSALSNRVATFGSFPLPRDRDALAEVVDLHVDAFVEAGRSLLVQRPMDVEALAIRLHEAVEERRRPLLIEHLQREVTRGRTSSRPAVVVDALEQLGELRALTNDEEQWLNESRAAVAAEPPALVRSSDETDREWLERRASHVRATAAELDRAFESRGSPAGAEGWDDAARSHRRALDLMYPADFWERVELLRQGDASQINLAIEFLDVDPWCFRSGYVKQRLLEILSKHTFDAGQLRRLERVLLRAVDVGDRREFNLNCRLARRLQSPYVRRELHERILSGDPGIARRALWMLMAMRRPRLSPAEIAVAQAIVFDAALDEDRWWSARSWIQRLLPSIEREPWVRSIVDGATHDRDPRCLRLLSELRTGNLSSEHAAVLAELVLEAVRAGDDEDESWLEGIAPLARRDDLMDELQRLRNSPDGDIQRRAWWAVRAIQRSV